MMNEHTAKAFDTDLQELIRKVSEMGGLAEREIADAIQALTRRDSDLAMRVVAADPTIDALQQEIEEKAVLTIARRQPMAVDLREIVAALRVSNDLERIGDLAKNIGKRVSALDGDFYPSKLLRGVEHMASLVLAQLKHVLDAYAARDLEAAHAVWNGDEEIDAMCTSLFRELLTYHDGRPPQHHLLHPPDVLRQEHRAHGRSRHQYRRDRALHGRRQADRRPAAQGRHHRLRQGRAAVAGAIHGRENPDRRGRGAVGAVAALQPRGRRLRRRDHRPRRRGDTRLREAAPDLVVLDWMLPGLSGIELCRRLRSRPESKALPIIMLTARGEESERVRGLATGADDYIVKPFSVPELIARVRALLRRASPERVADVLAHGDIELDREKKRVSRGGREIELGPTEYRLLEFLMERPGRVFSREQLLDGVWGSEVYIDERTVDVHVGRLRKALNRGREADPIRTVRGAGYALDDRFGRSAA